MADDNFTLTMFYEEWKRYLDHLQDALAPLTAEQLALRAAPDLRSIDEIGAHMIRARVGWFTDFLGEGREDAVRLERWEAADQPARDGGELVQGLEASWKIVTDALARWSPDDMRKTFGQEWRGDHYELPRSWVVWHLLEHDLHHGGEISLTLGAHGLQAPDI